MKPSEMEKDGNASVRMNKKIKSELKAKGITPQKIIDAYIDSLLNVEVEIKWKAGPK